ncbi:hypothetical protein J7T55_001351 [Diaporthe amygdali]|uniref:uncharacterized protein n=1 Tax=Phomopsis amygdali TaxID=1214568 RepID=UPI0022FF443C|nr:uncharacterized protein J7T55_001351 [Diaporthe amygdali]KAJ0106827.1 hypothetical protein J7T55_001351 [Diaporthe amygdali]
MGIPMAPKKLTGQELIDLASQQDPIKIGGFPIAVIGLSATLCIISGLCMILRIFVRAWLLRKERSWGWDDTLALLSFLTFLPECVFVIIAARYGLGTPDAELNELVTAQAALMMGNWQMFYAASTNLIKAAIAVTLLRLTDQPKYRWPITASLVATPIFTGAVVIVLIVTCRPVGAQWDLDLGPCPLHNWLAILSYPFTALTIILDWGCAIIPWLLIRKLQLNRRIKRSLIIVLGLGGTASIGAIARLPYLKYYTIPEDQLFIWSVFENGLGIIAASLPPIHKLFKFYNDTSVGSSTPAGGGAFETIGGTPLSQSHGAYELKPLRNSSRLTVTRSGQWNRLDDEGPNQELIMVRRTFSIMEENDVEEARKIRSESGEVLS